MRLFASGVGQTFSFVAYRTLVAHVFVRPPYVDVRARVLETLDLAALHKLLSELPGDVLFSASEAFGLAPPAATPVVAAVTLTPASVASVEGQQVSKKKKKAQVVSASASSSSTKPMEPCALGCTQSHRVSDCARLAQHRKDQGLQPLEQRALTKADGCIYCGGDHFCSRCDKFKSATIALKYQSVYGAVSPVCAPVSAPSISPVASGSNEAALRTALRMPVRIGNTSLLATVDTGASTSCIDEALSKRLGVVVRPGRSPARVPGAIEVVFTGAANVTLSFGGVNWPVVLNVLPNLGHDVLLGSPELWPANGVGRLKISDPPLGAPATSCLLTLAGSQPVLAHTSAVALSSSPPEIRVLAAVSASPTDVVEYVDGHCWVGDQLYTYAIEGVGLTRCTADDGMEWLHLPSETWAALESLTDCTDALTQGEEVRARLQAVLAAINVAPDLESAESWSGDTSPPTSASAVLSASAGSVMDTLPDCLDVGISPGVSDDVVRGTGLLMRKFAHVFGGSMRPGTWQAPPANRSQAFAVTLIHAVEPDARTHRAPPRRYSPAAHAAITAQIERWEEAGIIVPSSSPYSSALVAIRKKPVKPEDEPEYRIVVDYRWRNANALMAATPMPTVADCVARAASGKRVSSRKMRGHSGISSKSRMQ